jgi:hypothetical protein
MVAPLSLDNPSMILWGGSKLSQVVPLAQENRNVLSKLLNMRDFRPVSGFPTALKTRYTSTCGKG